jgi:hypothetical protein
MATWDAVVPISQIAGTYAPAKDTTALDFSGVVYSATAASGGITEMVSATYSWNGGTWQSL